MPVPSAITALSQTPGSNSPPGTENPTTADDYLRTYAAFIAGLRDGVGFTNPVILASAATTEIGAQNSMFVDISGVTTITSFGTTYRGPRFLRFTGAMLLTHNATALNLIGGANITTVAGDTAMAVPNQALTGWNVVQYTRGSALAALAGTLANSGITGAAASGANVDITSLGNTTSTVYATAGTATAYTITPNPAITAYAAGQAFKVSFGLASGAAPTLQISGIATPPNLVSQLANGTYANIAAGAIPASHTSDVRLLGATQALVVTMPPAFVSGSVIQTVTFDTGALATGTTLIPVDDTIPQQAEGDQYMSLAITPKVASSVLVIDVCAVLSPSAQVHVGCAVFRDAAADSVGAVLFSSPAGFFIVERFTVRVAAASTTATTFKVRAGPGAAATITFNGSGGLRIFGGAIASSIRITEIAA